jgi:hypothetical protein
MDIAFPKNNEKEFLEIAEKLNVEIKFAEKVKQGYKADNMLISNNGERKNFESKQIKLFYDLENRDERDFIHQRNSGLNQILAKIAHDKNKIIAFNFSTILNSEPEKRAQILGRMKQNVKLCRKYKVKMFVGTFANNPYELRGKYELKAFAFMIGMNPKEIKECLTF